MKRKQRKSLPWRKFGYVILIIKKFGEVFLWFSPIIINALRSYMKHSKECFIRYLKTSKLVKKKTPLRLVFSTHFLVFGYLTKHSSLCLIYYLPLAWGGTYSNRSGLKGKHWKSVSGDHIEVWHRNARLLLSIIIIPSDNLSIVNK